MPESDADQVDRLLRMITSSDAEAGAFRVALALRADAVCQSEHFRRLHAHLVNALLRDGELGAADLKVELQRAELRFAMATTLGDTDEQD